MRSWGGLRVKLSTRIVLEGLGPGLAGGPGAWWDTHIRTPQIPPRLWWILQTQRHGRQTGGQQGA